MTIPVVGIGASAGGLEAFKLLLAHLPADTGLAFVFIQHLDPKHHSNLTEILARISPVPVELAADGHAIEPNHLYVIPPDAELEIANQALRLTPRPPASSGPHTPIDHFLRSLAQECGSRAIGVVLSGASSDGAAGLEALKTAGGVTFAQYPATAKFDSMPQAAIGRGCVDFVLAPEAIAAELAKLGHHPYVTEDKNTWQPARATKGWFESILTLLRNATGVDFALYHANTVQRRILRRLALCDIRSLEEYREQLERDPGELSALHQDLLIDVTSFFRDRESFEDLKKLVLPRLVKHRSAVAPIRIWAAGCATGEEAYSIAISLKEYLEETGCIYPVQIFASDSSATAVEKARSGKYAENIATDVGPERLRRHFSKIDGGYQISKTLREMCVFSRHDLMHDPPFSKLDLIICQNVLISFGSARKQVVERFHYALKPGGFLVLGRSETESGNLFSIVPGTHSICVRNETAARQHLFYRRRPADAYDRLRGSPADQPAKAIDVRKEIERRPLSRYEGTGVVLDEELEVLEILGSTAPYLSRPSEKQRLKLLKLIPETRLFVEVERLVREVQGSGVAARKNRVPYQADREPGEVNIQVIPLGGARPRGFLVLFEPVRGEPEIQPPSDSDPRDREIAELKQDLADARQRLLSIIVDQLSTTEQSQNAAEEAISANEELHCLNEELETAKEDLQSTNEQLNTMNEELQSNNVALTEARDFAMSVIDAAATPLLVLDTKLRIKTANPSFHRAFRLSAVEAQGQLIFSLSNGAWDIPRLRDMLQHILPDHKSVQDFEIEQNFPGVGHRVLVLNARQLDGLQQILLGIEDVTERQKRAEATLHESEERFRTMADAAPVMIWVAGPDSARTFFNRGWLVFTGRTLQQELGNGWTKSVYPQDLDRCMDTYSSSFDARRRFQMEYRLRRQDGEYRWMLDNGVPRFEPSGAFVGYIGSCVDITDVKRAETERLAKQKLESVGTLASGIAHDFNNLLGGVLASSDLALAELSGGSSPTEELQRIRAAAIRGAEIVRQLMIYAGQESEVLESVDVSQIVEEMIELLTLSVSKRVTLETDLRKALPAVRANRGQLRQIVMNLITNASDAIGDREGLIRVTTRRMAIDGGSPLARSGGLGQGDYVQLEVSDTGGGMTPETQAQVFDPFFTTKPAGHGLGLAVVQGIVRGLGGTIRLVSALGKGTMFQILLPCSEGKAQATPSPISYAEAAKPRSAEATILVVEDEELIRRAASKMLHKQGFSVIEASDGSVALDLIRALDETIDVLVLDVTLPGASSREVFEEAKRLRPAMPVIVSSANTEEMAATSLAGKVERFIRKPFRLDDLCGLIRETLVSS